MMPPFARRLSQLGWPQFITLGALAAVALGLLVFVSLANEMLEGETHGFDQAILLAFRNPADLADPIGPAWVEIMMADLTALGSVAVLAVMGLVTLGGLLVLRRWVSAVLLLVSFAGGSWINFALKTAIDRPRPDLVAKLAEVHTQSFPSGHAMLSAVVYLTLGTLLAGVMTQQAMKAYVMGVAVALTLIVGISRVYLGVHWPTDVLGGWCLGATWAMGCWLAVRLWRVWRA